MPVPLISAPQEKVADVSAGRVLPAGTSGVLELTVTTAPEDVAFRSTVPPLRLKAFARLVADSVALVPTAKLRPMFTVALAVRTRRCAGVYCVLLRVNVSPGVAGAVNVPVVWYVVPLPVAPAAEVVYTMKSVAQFFDDGSNENFAGNTFTLPTPAATPEVPVPPPITLLQSRWIGGGAAGTGLRGFPERPRT